MNMKEHLQRLENVFAESLRDIDDPEVLKILQQNLSSIIDGADPADLNEFGELVQASSDLLTQMIDQHNFHQVIDNSDELMLSDWISNTDNFI